MSRASIIEKLGRTAQAKKKARDVEDEDEDEDDDDDDESADGQAGVNVNLEVKASMDDLEKGHAVLNALFTPLRDKINNSFGRGTPQNKSSMRKVDKIKVNLEDLLKNPMKLAKVNSLKSSVRV